MATKGPFASNSTPRKAVRSFSTPAKRQTPSAQTTTTTTAAIGEAAGIETLYTNSNGKVVKFNCASSGSRPSSSAGGAHSSPTTGTLPWATLTEQTLAAGPLEIYRVPGSVSFLHSGSLLHAILPRSNCWCVDGVSKFAMRVLTDTYYRIELPGETEEDLARVEEFKATLKKVLFYERTACPFARTFDVPLPEEQAPRRMRRNTAHGPAKKWKQDRAYSWKPEDGEEAPQMSTSEEEGEGEGEASLSGEEIEDIATTITSDASVPHDIEAELESEVQRLKISSPSRPSVRDRVKGLSMRSVTAPQQASLHSNLSSRPRIAVPSTANADDVETMEPRAFQAIPTNMPPSPPDSSAGFEYAEHTTPQDDEEIGSSEHSLQNHRLRPRLEETSSLMGVNLAPELRAAADWQEGATRFPDRTPDSAPMCPVPQKETSFATDGNATMHAHVREDIHGGPITDHDREEILDRVTSLPQISQDATTLFPIRSSRPQTTPKATPDADPFAQIQARIQARRSIGGTTTSGFEPHPRQTSISTQGASPPSVQRTITASTGKTLSHKSSSISRHSSQKQQHLATALVKKACAVFLGPPANLVVLMLRIAARFAKGVFPHSLLYESPRGERRKVPGSFHLDESDEDYGLSSDDEPLDGEEWEDDFGVPINNPVRHSSARSLQKSAK